MDDGLEQLKIKGLCSLSDVVLSPGRLTALIGSNGSGKSNILRALKMGSLVRTASLQHFVAQKGGAAALLHYGPKKTPSMMLEFDFRDHNQLHRYIAKLGFAADDRLFFLEESIGHQPTPAGVFNTTSLGGGHWESKLDGLKDQSPIEPDHKAWHRINQLVRRIAPVVKKLRPTASHNGTSTARLDWIDDQDAVFGAHQLSDGTLRAIALITALAQPTASLPRLISIDEPELGLHPSAIALLAELARSISRHTQVIFATQSTLFLDHFAPSEVVVVERTGGETTLRHLEETALETWLEEYSLSELYGKGVLGGRP